MAARRFPGGASLSALALASLAVTGCTTPPTTPTPGGEVAPLYEAEFDLAMEQATTGLERRILADYVITREEYLEIKNVAIGCIRSHGLTAELQDMESGVFQMAVGGSWDEDLVHETMQACETPGFSAIEALYVDLVTNPGRRDLDDLAAGCLVAVGFVDEPFTGRDYARESHSPGFTSRAMDDPEGAKCVQNPSYRTGSGPH